MTLLGPVKRHYYCPVGTLGMSTSTPLSFFNYVTVGPVVMVGLLLRTMETSDWLALYVKVQPEHLHSALAMLIAYLSSLKGVHRFTCNCMVVCLQFSINILTSVN